MTRSIKQALKVIEDELFTLITRDVACRYLAALTLLNRVYEASEKLHWEEGDSLDAVLVEVNDFLDNEMGRERRGEKGK